MQPILEECLQHCEKLTTIFKYGPYIRKGIPPDPIKQISTVVVTSTGAQLTAAADTGGWLYDTLSGQIVMNSNANDSKGTIKYYQH